jgi:hypothetical protein
MAFPLTVLNTTVEILINNTWYDITTYVYNRATIKISYGRLNEAFGFSPAQMSLVLNNRDGSFSPKNASSQFFPYLARNTQIRVSINDTSTSSITYSGFRFWGQVSRWPPEWDTTGNDVWVTVTAGGTLRRLQQGKAIGSCLRRFYMLKSASDATRPVAYWPMEELQGSLRFGNLIIPGDDMTWTSTPTLSSDSSFPGSDPLPLVSKSQITGSTGSYSQSGPVTWSTPGTYFWTAPGSVTSLSTVETWGAGGGGVNGFHNDQHGGAAGGGGGYAKNTAVAVTPGNQYKVVVGAGGKGGGLSSNGTVGNNGAAGGTSSFAGDAVTTSATGGGGGTTAAYPGGQGAGGTGTGATAFSGGHGGQNNNGGSFGGSGGGGSAGTAANGNNGTDGGTSNTGANGGTAVTGGAAGHKGGNGGPGVDQGGAIANSPGGGGAGGGDNSSNHAAHSGGNGGAGQVKINFTSSTTPNNVVTRFLVKIPFSSIPTGTVLLRNVIASGSLTKTECYYSTTGGGSIGFRGYNGATLKFDTGTATMTNMDGNIYLVSLELAVSGTAIAYTLNRVRPGNATGAPATGSLATSTIGAISQIVIGPNNDVPDVVIGHVVVQYALEDLQLVSGSANGHFSEAALKRFIRLCNEEGINPAFTVVEGLDHFGFESGVQGWTALTNCTVSSVTTTGVSFYTWPTEGTHSLKIVPTTNATWTASSPTGLSGIPCVAGDLISGGVDLTTNTTGAMTVTGVSMQVIFYDNTGAALTSLSAGALTLSGAGVLQIGFEGLAPTNSAFYALQLTGSGFTGTGQQIFVDNVCISPMMGVQTDQKMIDLLSEMETAGGGQISEDRNSLGLVFRTRISMLNQSPDVTINYANATIAGAGLKPAYDDQVIRNDIVATRINGSTVGESLQSGAMSVQDPPNGVGDYPYTPSVSLFVDLQMNNWLDWALALGTVDEYRYPQIPIDLHRTQLAGSGLFDLIPALAVGDYLQITNPPSWIPTSPTKQLCWGFVEEIGQYTWTININGVPEAPYEVGTAYGWW